MGAVHCWLEDCLLRVHRCSWHVERELTTEFTERFLFNRHFSVCSVCSVVSHWGNAHPTWAQGGTVPLQKMSLLIYSPRVRAGRSKRAAQNWRFGDFLGKWREDFLDLPRSRSALRCALAAKIVPFCKNDRIGGWSSGPRLRRSFI